MIHEYYRQMLNELDIVWDADKTALFLTRAVFNKILDGDLDAREGGDFIFRDVLDYLDLGKEWLHRTDKLSGFIDLQ